MACKSIKSARNVSKSISKALHEEFIAFFKTVQIEMMKMFTFLNPLMPGGNKESYILETKLQVFVSTYDLLLPAEVKGLTNLC